MCIYVYIFNYSIYKNEFICPDWWFHTCGYIFHPTRQSFLYTHCHATAVDNIHAET